MRLIKYLIFFLPKFLTKRKRDSKELEFQWKEHKDSPVEFQIRLINLYKSGMYDFLKKKSQVFLMICLIILTKAI